MGCSRRSYVFCLYTGHVHNRRFHNNLMVDHTYTSSDYDKGSIFSFKGWSSGSHQ